jgi:uncharacterized membrane protein
MGSIPGTTPPEDERIAALTAAVQNLTRRVYALEQRIGQAGGEPESPAPEPPPAPAAAPVPPEETAPVRAPGQLETRVGLTWVNRAGVVTLILAAAFFFKYAVDNRWIGETGRVVLGAAAGLGGIALAVRLWKRGHDVYAQGIAGAGIAILYLSFYASFGFYQLLGQAPAFLLMALTTVTGGILAIRYRAAAILFLGLLGGYLTPLLLRSSEDRPWVFFAYVLLLNVGGLAAARRQGWRGVEWLAFLATAALYAVWFDSRFEPGKETVATTFALVYFVLFGTVAAQALAMVAMLAVWDPQVACLWFALVVSAIGLILGDIRDRAIAGAATAGMFWLFAVAWYAGAAGPWRSGAIVLALTAAAVVLAAWLPWRMIVRRVAASRLDLAAVALNGPVFFGLGYDLLHRDHHGYVGLFAVVLAGAHLAIGFRLRREPDGRPAHLYAGLALVFLILAPAVQFTGYRVTMIWAVEAAALAWIGFRTGALRLHYASLLIFLLTLGRLYFLDARVYSDSASYALLANTRFAAFFAAAAALGAASWWMRTGWTALAAYCAGHVVMVWALGLEVVGWAERNALAENLTSARSASVSVLIAAYALVLVGFGIVSRSAVNRVLGLAFVALVVAKLYLHDVWLLSRIHRVTAFAVLGALLLLTSYLYSRYRTGIQRLWGDGRDQ